MAQTGRGWQKSVPPDEAPLSIPFNPSESVKTGLVAAWLEASPIRHPRNEEEGRKEEEKAGKGWRILSWEKLCRLSVTLLSQRLTNRLEICPTVAGWLRRLPLCGGRQEGKEQKGAYYSQ